MDIESIKAANPIEEVVGESHPLKKGGRRYLNGMEHDSLVVDTQKQYYVWNSQGHSGDVINWLENTRRMGFKEAVEFLCKRAGLPYEWDGRDEATHKAARIRYEAITVMAEYMAGRLAGSASATEYATKGRGWSAETVKDAHLGFWDGDHKKLADHLKMHQIDLDRPEVVAVLGFKGDVGKWAEKWGVKPDPEWVKRAAVPAMPGGRLIYAHYVGGRAVYLSGRAIDPNAVPKHYNMPQELVGPKQAYWNAAYYRRADHVVVVEGQADAVTLGQWGIAAVALAGLSDTPALVTAVKAHKAIYVALDNDAAGTKGINKIAAEFGAGCFVVRWPKGVKDANDWLVKDGAETTAKQCPELLGDAMIFAEYLCELAATAEPMKADEARRVAIDAVASLPEYTFAERKSRLAGKLGLGQAQLTSLVKALQKEKVANKAAAKTEKTTPNGFIDDHLFEMVYDPTHEKGPRTAYAVRMPDGKITIMPVLETENYRFTPFSPMDSLIEANVIRLPSKLENYESDMALQQRIQAFIHKYVDLPHHIELLASYYVMMTWLYDVFYVLPYLRARGNSDSGKSRFTEVIGELCMRAIFVTGSTTPSPVFRTMEKWHGLTLIMDEADLPHSETAADWVQMFNTGYKRGFSILRTAMKDGDATVEAFNSFGPKVLNMRGRFVDDATESRCMTWDASVGRGIRPDIPRYIVDREGYLGEARSIRNQLLMFRLRKWKEVKIDYNHEGMKDMPGRLTEITVSLMSITDEEEFKKSIMGFVEAMNQDAIMQRSSTIPAKVLEGILRAYYTPDKTVMEFTREEMRLEMSLGISHITRQTNDVINHENREARAGDEPEDGKNSVKLLSPVSIGRVISNDLNLKTRKGTVGTKGMTLVWEQERIGALIVRYGMEELVGELMTKRAEMDEKARQMGLA